MLPPVFVETQSELVQYWEQAVQVAPGAYTQDDQADGTLLREVLQVQIIGAPTE